MRRALLIAFVLTQLTGELMSWLMPRVGGPEAPWLWLGSVLLLLPGDLIATWIVEKLLWNSGLSLAELSFVKAFCEVAMNAVVWSLVAAAMLRLYARFRRGNAVRPGVPANPSSANFPRKV